MDAVRLSSFAFVACSFSPFVLPACDALKPESKTSSAEAKTAVDSKVATDAKATEAKAGADAKAAEAKAVAEAKAADTKAAADTKTVAEAKAPADTKAVAEAKTPVDTTASSASAAGTVATVHPDAVLAASSTDPPATWKLLDAEEGAYEEIGGSRRLWFRTHAFSQAGTSYTLALWGLDENTAQIHAALLSGADGAWKPEWVKRPFIEDDEGPEMEVYLPDIVQIGPERWALLHSPYLVACGAAPCAPEDDYVDNTLYEVTPTGPVEIWKLHGSICQLPDAESTPEPNLCFLAFEPGATADAYDLVVTIQRKRKKKPPQRHVYRDGRYTPAK